MAKTVAAQISEDSELYEELQEFSADYESQSEAVRALLRAGLDTKRPTADSPEPDAPLAGDAYVLLATAFGAIGGGIAVVSAVVGALFMLLGVLPGSIPAIFGGVSIGVAMLVLGALAVVWRMVAHTEFGLVEELAGLVRGGGR